MTYGSTDNGHQHLVITVQCTLQDRIYLKKHQLQKFSLWRRECEHQRNYGKINLIGLSIASTQFKCLINPFFIQQPHHLQNAPEKEFPQHFNKEFKVHLWQFLPLIF